MTQIAWKDGHPIMVNGGIGEAPGCCCGGECCCLAASINGETGTDDGTSNWTWNIGPASKTSISGWWEGPAADGFYTKERVEFSASCVGGQWQGTVTHTMAQFELLTPEEQAGRECKCVSVRAFTVACDGTVTYGDYISGPTASGGDCEVEGADPFDPCAWESTYLAFAPASCCACESLTLATERTLVFTFDKNRFPACTSPTLEMPFSSLATCVNGLLVFETGFDGYLCDPDAGNTIYCATLTVYFSVDPGCNCDTEADCNLTIEAWESSCTGRLVDVSFAP